MIYTMDIANFTRNYKIRVSTQLILFFSILLLVSYHDIDNAWTTLVLIFVAGYVFMEIVLYKFSKASVASYKIELQEACLCFSGKGFHSSIKYADIKMIKVKKKQAEVHSFVISAPYISQLKIKNINNINELFIALQKKLAVNSE